MKNLLIFTDDNGTMLQNFGYPNMPESFLNDIEKIKNTKETDKGKLCRLLDEFYIKKIEKLIGKNSNIELLEAYSVLRSFGVGVNSKELDFFVNKEEIIDNPFLRYQIGEVFSFENIEIKDNYLEDDKKTDQNFLEKNVLSILENDNFELKDIEQVKNLLIIGESFRLGDNFRLNFQQFLNNQIDSLENNLKLQINEIKGELVKIAGEKKDLKNKIILREQKLVLLEELIGENLNSKDFTELFKKIYIILEKNNIDNSLKEKLIKYLENFKEYIFEKYYNKNKKIISFNRNIEKERLLENFDNELKNNTNLFFEKYYEKNKESLRLEFVSEILDFLEKYKNSLDISYLTNNYNNLVEKETNLGKQKNKIEQDIKQIQIKKAYKNDILESNLVSIQDDLNDFYENSYKLDNNKKIIKINDLLKKLENLKEYIQELDFYKKNRYNLKKIKRKIEQNIVYKKLEENEDVFENLELLETVQSSKIKEGIKKYIKQKAEIIFWSLIFKNDFEKAIKLENIILDKNKVLNYFVKLDKDIKNLENNLTNFKEIKNITNYDFSFITNKKIKNLFEYDLNKKLVLILKNKINVVLNTYNKDSKKEIVSDLKNILEEKSVVVIYKKIEELFQKYYNIDDIKKLDFSYFNSDTFNNYKNFKIEKLQDFYNEENYKNIFEYELNLDSTKLFLSYLGINNIIVSNNYFLDIDVITLNSNDKNLDFFNEMKIILEKIKNIDFEINIKLELNFLNFRKINNFLDNFDKKIYSEKNVKKIILTNYNEDGKEKYIDISEKEKDL